MRLSHWAIAILIGSVLSCGGTADFTGPTAIDTPGAVSFADLGWTDDVVVKGDSPSATVDVILPEDVEQGNPLWYGVRLDFEISGTPGLPEDAAYLVGSWNKRAMYFMPLEKMAGFDDGFRWTTHEPLYGWHMGYETTDYFSAASTSFAILDAVRGGMNTIAIHLDMSLASNPDFQVRVRKESQVVAVQWRETQIEWKGRAEIDGELVVVDFQGRNTGQAATDFRITAVIYRDDTSVSFHTHDVGALEQGGELNYSDIISITPGSPVFAVDLDLEWNGGRDYLRLWPAAPDPSWYERVPRPFRSTVGALVAMVAVWIGLPALVRRLRGRRDDAESDVPTLTLSSPRFLGRLLKRLRISRWTVGVGLAGIGAAVAALVWIAPWSGVNGDDWRPQPTTLPLGVSEDKETLKQAATVFLDMSGLAAMEGAPTVANVNHVKLISRNGKRIGVYAAAALQPEVWVEGTLMLIRCREQLIWEGEAFWLDKVQVWVMDGDEIPYSVVLSDFHGELGEPDAHIVSSCPYVN